MIRAIANRRLLGINKSFIRCYAQVAQATNTTPQRPIQDVVREKLLNNPEELGWHQGIVGNAELAGASEEQQQIVKNDEFQHDW